jgi:hypothetical protein
MLPCRAERVHKIQCSMGLLECLESDGPWNGTCHRIRERGFIPGECRSTFSFRYSSWLFTTVIFFRGNSDTIDGRVNSLIMLDRGVER